jgi:hypothetical protein
VSSDGGERLARPGHAVTAPTGGYRLEVVPGEYSGSDGTGTFERIRILDDAGATVHDSSKRFSTRGVTDVLWDEDVARAWVYSSDVGTYYWDRGGDGAWTMRALGPQGIADGEPAPPGLLVERHPDVFGPKGRAKARRLADRQGGSSAGPATVADDPRIMH